MNNNIEQLIKQEMERLQSEGFVGSDKELYERAAYYVERILRN